MALGAPVWAPIGAGLLMLLALFVPTGPAALLLVAGALLTTAATPLVSLFLPQWPLAALVAILAALPVFLVAGDGRVPWRAAPSYALAVTVLFLAGVFARWSPTFLASDAAARAQTLLLAVAVIVVALVLPRTGPARVGIRRLAARRQAGRGPAQP